MSFLTFASSKGDPVGKVAHSVHQHRKGSGQLASLLCPEMDLVLRFTQPLQRGAAKIMSSSAQGGHWKLIPGEEGQGGAEGSSRRRPKPRGQNTPCSNFLPRALHRFWQQETQKIYGKNRKKKNLSWALTILSCQSQLNMQCIIKATLHWWYRIYERCPVSY